MSRKDYIALAAALKECRASPAIVLAVAKVCADDNPRFDYGRFMIAAQEHRP